MAVVRVWRGVCVAGGVHGRGRMCDRGVCVAGRVCVVVGGACVTYSQ